MNLRSALLGVAATAALLLTAPAGHTQGTGFQFPGSPWNSFAPGEIQCGTLLGANMNITTDQAIAISVPSASWAISNIQISNPSISLTTAVGGFYTGAGKTGVTVVANSQAYSGLTTHAANTTGNYLIATLSTAGTTTMFQGLSGSTPINTLYFALTTAQGAAATADIRVRCRPLF
jgi:hypothetical protein